ncbi:MAG: hypothetical protein ABR582_12930 [Gemmatimonadaceae bacterium]
MGSLKKILLLAIPCAGVTALSACGELVDPALPPNAQALSPPPVYARWWAMTESCSGLSGDLASINWIEVPGAATFQFGSDLVNGYWSAASNRIVLSEDAILDGGVVRHEMLHALVRRRGHTRADFLTNCGGVVDCGAQCLDDAGPPAPLDASVITVPGDSIVVGVEVDPEAPKSTIDDGFFTIAVTARNPAAHRVFVQFLFGGTGIGWSFHYSMRGPLGEVIGGEPPLDPGIAIFAAGETKRQVFDFTIGGNRHPLTQSLASGTYTVQGTFAGHSAVRAPVVVGP